MGHLELLNDIQLTPDVLSFSANCAHEDNCGLDCASGCVQNDICKIMDFTLREEEE